MLGTLQLGKTPGPDRIPIEFDKTYAKDLISHIHSMLVGFLAASSLPGSMSKAVIVVILPDAPPIALSLC